MPFSFCGLECFAVYAASVAWSVAAEGGYFVRVCRVVVFLCIFCLCWLEVLLPSGLAGALVGLFIQLSACYLWRSGDGFFRICWFALHMLFRLVFQKD